VRSLQVAFIIFIITVSCKKDAAIEQEYILMQTPVGFPSMPIAEGNEYTKERWELGKRLFYDPILSNSNKISCASCHLAKNAFSDTTTVSVGDNAVLGKSNSPTLTNVGYNPYYTRAGGVFTLEMQILVPIQEHDEFNSNILDIADRLNLDSTYIKQSLLTYNRSPDPFVITRAIANFERSLMSGNSRFDQYYYQGKQDILTKSEKNGLNLFFSEKTNCSQCHSDFNFTNYTFQNNGLYELYKDNGRKRLTLLDADEALFKVPTLRNVGVTAPYMHDGSLKSIPAVVEHYISGGKNHKNKSAFIKPLILSNQEKNDLIAFLLSLTDDQFINVKQFRIEN
jgi:cytochrome c peroxidase